MTTLALKTNTLDPNDIREQLHLSRERIGQVLRVSAKTIERWERQHTLPDTRAKKDFFKLKQIADLVQSIYSPEGVTAFLTTPLASFDERTALELMALGDFDRVISALAADFEGLGS